MGKQGAWSLTAAVVLSASVTFAQSATQQQTSAAAVGDTEEAPVTLVGCIQREADYRRTHDLGRGGTVGTGIGRGNEYVLINAARAGSGSSTPAVDCSFESSPEAYELTGSRERDLEPFVGRVVQISGTLKSAETRPVGTSGQREPTGGVDPLGQDLRLREVNVTSFQAVGTTGQSEPARRPAAQAAPSPAPETSADPADRREPSAADPPRRLPQTAGSLPLAGLLGALSLGGALGLRRLRRADRY